jgi:predicted aspartyl protease
MAFAGRHTLQGTVPGCIGAQSRRLVAAVLIAAAVAGLPRASAQGTDGDVAGAATSAEPEPLYAAPTRLDRVGRVLAAVEINGQGPFRFIVDTGANRSAIAPETVAKLGLVLRAEDSVDVHGVTGSAELPSVTLDTLQVGEIVLRRPVLPVLASAVFAGADGILGNEGLADARLEVDFADDRVTIAPSTGRRITSSDTMTVPVRLEHGGLLMTEGRMGRVSVHVVIDTGAERTIGNEPLRDALLKSVPADRRAPATVLGATPEVAKGVTFLAPALLFGRVRLRNLPITFGDLHVFEVWGLADEPAVVIGMDMIGTLRKFAVDYRRQELLLTTYGGNATDVHRCGPNECATRIPQPGSGQ